MSGHSKKLLIVGGKGMLAQAIVSSAPGAYELTSVDLPDFDMTDRTRVLSYVDALQPDIIINCAAYTNVDGCETEQTTADLVNGAAVGYLAEAALSVDATLVHISTDYVFDGEKKSPYLETDRTNPRSAYGRSKLLGEQALLASGLKKYFVVRTSWLYGPGGKNFVETIIRLAGERDELRIVDDQIGCPTYTVDLAQAIFNLLEVVSSPRPPVSSPYGIYHVSNEGQCSWYEFAREIVALAREGGVPLRVERVQPINTEDYPLPAKRPAYSVFSKEKYSGTIGKLMPDWKQSLKVYFAKR